MFKGLFKPKWQHRKSAVRLQALLSLEGSSDALIDLAVSDPDIDVRLGAIQRLQHIPTLKQLADGTTEKEPETVKKGVKKRVVELILTQPNLAELEVVYYLIDDQKMHQKVVCDGKQCAAIRLQALEYIDDQEILFKLADTDESRQIQFLAATKLTDYKQLQKLKRLAKTNKKFRHLLKQKTAEYQQQQNFLNQVETICRGLETLVENADTAPDPQCFSALKKQWQQLERKPSAAAKQRFDQTVVQVEKAYAAYEKQEQERQPLRDKAESILHALDDLSHALLHTPNDFTQQEFSTGLQTLKVKWQVLSEQLHDNERLRYSLEYDDKVLAVEQTLFELAKDFQTIEKMKQLCSKADNMLTTKRPLQKKAINDLEKYWNQLPAVFSLDSGSYHSHYAEVLHKIKQRFEKQMVQRVNAEQEIEALLTQVEHGIENDQFKGAIKAYHRVNKQLKEATYLNKNTMASFNRRIRAVTPVIRQAESWRHWGTDKAREQLIEQATDLISVLDIEPLERAKKVKTLRDEWKKLGKMDPSRHQHLWREFDAACSKAYEPCQQYFKDESVQRDKNLQQRHQVCEQLEILAQETDWNSVDWRAITKSINALQNQWRKAGNVNRASWKTVNKRFNQAMDDLEVHLGKERRRNWLQRQNLITQAEALVATLNDSDGESIEQAIESAIQEGKALQAQWQPTVTAKRSEEQKLWLQFRAAIDAVYERQRNERDAVQNVLKDNLQQKRDLLAEAESIANQQGEALLTNQHQLATIEEQFYPLNELPRGERQKIDKAFSEIKIRIAEQLKLARRQRKLTQLLVEGKEQEEKNNTTTVDANTDESVTIDKALALLLEIEILLGLETPKDYQQERMQYQVGRLSEKMLTVTEEQHSDEEQALQKIQQWYLLEPIHGDVGLMIHERFEPIRAWLEKQAAGSGS